MEFWGNVFHMPPADEYIVKAVAKDGYYKGVWQVNSRHESKAEAFDAADWLIKSGRYTRVGIEPHCTEMGIFQTHPLQEVWAA